MSDDINRCSSFCELFPTLDFRKMFAQVLFFIKSFMVEVADDDASACRFEIDVRNRPLQFTQMSKKETILLGEIVDSFGYYSQQNCCGRLSKVLRCCGCTPGRYTCFSCNGIHCHGVVFLL